MTDSLDSLPDSALNELFAVEVAGWKFDDVLPRMYGQWYRPGSDRPEAVPKFCTEANVALCWLETIKDNSAKPDAYFRDGKWRVEIRTGFLVQSLAVYEGCAPTFARAAVLALIRAARGAKIKTT